MKKTHNVSRNLKSGTDTNITVEQQNYSQNPKLGLIRSHVPTEHTNKLKLITYYIDSDVKNV